MSVPHGAESQGLDCRVTPSMLAQLADEACAAWILAACCVAAAARATDCCTAGL